MPYRPLAGRIDEAADRIVKRLHRRVLDVDHYKVGSGAWRDPPEIVAARDGGGMRWAVPPHACYDRKAARKAGGFT
jgi:hypothetical protein